MPKTKTTFFCQNCGAQSAKWIGKCPSCEQWNTYVEEIIQKEDGNGRSSWRSAAKSPRVPGGANKPKEISEISYDGEIRIQVPDKELNRGLGGGIVPGSLVMIGGEPGIGKSTLLLQLALKLNNLKILYVTGEESEQQIKMRAERLNSSSSSSQNNCYILNETGTENIFQQIGILEPNLVIIDSIQTLHAPYIESGAGSISQVRACAAELLKYAKESGIPVFLIGHITKEGTLAGPKVLEHMVDTVLQFEGDRHFAYRILRTTKNRFGSTSELGIYEMLSTGLREVSNPSEILLSQREESLSGITIGATLEGNRPLLIEVQSLVSPAAYGTPQRSSTGFDAKRLNMLLAVLEKRGGFRLGVQDVFLNIAGGIKTVDPAIDLAVCMSILSSFEDITIPNTTCFAAEVGLGGEIRAVNRIENRITEAQKLGFKEMFISKYNKKGVDLKKFNIKINAVSKLDEVIEKVLCN
ncbi:MAG: DNA repair protein RadA [Bacteroidetes bacterium]|nr:DNA repair protein RadA [Bacteroidota bacterium]